ncbi:uncharacterized protein LOC122067871 [Macadamia integrifolia]|uniref:uncharacterized protein LOC122067871 n=1 Tax=Macadamia integrifolia TaxID=60698 RepID=UPI001C4F7140|nr:uncharacterized protein LOC122067871 [Macadamia integrifolia]
MENQEKLWLQKSKVRWLKEGDRCSRFFHVMTRIKRSKNTIRCITTEDGVDISDRDQMGSYLAEFYETFHKKVELEDHPQIFNYIPRILQDSDQEMLDAIPSEDVIKRAMWDLDPDSSPSPDGLTGVFFRKCWDIIHDDVYRAVKGFFSSVLRRFGFSGKMIGWIHTLLQWARISVLLNGSPIKPLLGPRGADVPTHLLFADDVFIFMNASKRYVRNLKSFLAIYQKCSGQFFNLEKSKLFLGKNPLVRKQWIAEELEIPCCNFQTKYLGVEIFQSRVKRDPLLPVMDKIKAKLAGLKGKLLSMAGRVELVKSVISRMSLHNFSVYWWPTPLIMNLEKWMKNFIWTGEIDSFKATTIKWDTIFKPKDEGGLGIRKRKVNMALIAKLAWSIKAEDSQLSRLLQARFLSRSGLLRRSYRRSSIWLGIRRMWRFISDNERWIIGNGRKINFWNDNWLGPKPIGVLFELNEGLSSNLNQTVADFIVDGLGRCLQCNLIFLQRSSKG